ncbi:C-type lectin domain-containing protein [Trichostrongylus colubriformis]|uniref:C-type lectin domain-containing protein n=1 Tax=Trichostrongylus colubriformis TaxID=6319 RepID=A0AAN8IAG1_TRICO
MNHSETMNANVLRITSAVVMLMKVSVWAQQPCTPWLYNIEFQKCYRKYCDERNPEDSQKVCQQHGGNLVTICSEAEGEFVGTLGHVATGYPNQNLQKTWIGYRRNPNNKEQWQWRSGSTCKYTNWWEFEPNNQAGNEDNAHLYTDYDGATNKWNDHSPDAYNYICERSTCPQEDVA